MHDASYVLGGWAIGLGSVAAYAVWVLRRGRAAAAQVPPDERRWSDS